MHTLDRIEAELARHRVMLEAILIRIGGPMAELDDLITQVNATVGEEASAIVAINGLSSAYEAAIAALPPSNEKAQLVALTAQLKASSAGIAAAIVALPAIPAPAASATPSTPAAPAASS